MQQPEQLLDPPETGRRPPGGPGLPFSIRLGDAGVRYRPMVPATVALLFALLGVLTVGVIVFFTGATQIVLARRRARAIRAPVIAAGVGFVIVLATGTALGTTGVTHMISTFRTFSASR